MGYFKWVKPKLKKMSLLDYAVLKTDVAIAGIIIGAYIASFVKMYVWYFVGAFVILYILLWKSLLSK